MALSDGEFRAAEQRRQNFMDIQAEWSAFAGAMTRFLIHSAEAEAAASSGQNRIYPRLSFARASLPAVRMGFPAEACRSSIDRPPWHPERP